ncbi:MAG: putative baseplate assembly protein [Dehalococcoidia bacterium]
MALPAPNLDDRKFQDLVREARARIPLYCPEWTDHNLSDPGITLIELFAWMVDVLLYRINKVPDKNYIKFMELIGVHLEPPQPARADVAFRLSAPQVEAITIPRGTSTATVRTETRDAITFTTERDLTIIPPVLSHALTSAEEDIFEDCMAALKNPDRRVPIFQESPAYNNALYLGFEENLKAQTLALDIESNIEGIGVDPNNPPLAWEYWDGENDRWAAMMVETDTTGGLNKNGRVVLHVPYTCAMKEVNGQDACWIRCRAIEPETGQRGYTQSPEVTSVDPKCIGGSVPVTHATRISGEISGRSDGSSGQRFYLQNTPVLPLTEEELVEVETDIAGQFEAWQEVVDFADSGPEDKHFTFDSVSGEIQFGVSIREPNGQERQYGMIPPSGRQIRVTSYRFGGGIIGNVGPGTITVLKSSIPYVASVTNFKPAMGGTEPESINRAKLRAPQVIRACNRAVTAEDFEYLAVQASSALARARCITAGMMGAGHTLPTGVVLVLLIPKVSKFDSPIPAEELELTRQLRDEVQAYLDERRLLGTRMEIGMPEYVPISLELRIKGKPGTDFDQVAAKIEKGLYRYVHPVSGGNDGNGWPFGRGITLPEVYALVQQIGDIDFIREAKIFQVNPQTGEREEVTSEMSVAANGIICSSTHKVVVEE